MKGDYTESFGAQFFIFQRSNFGACLWPG